MRSRNIWFEWQIQWFLETNRFDFNNYNTKNIC